MSALHRQLRRLREDADSGFTLIELMVATTIFLILSGITLNALLSTSRSSQSTREYVDLNEEARLVLNRITREIREASNIVAASNPVGTTYSATADSSIQFEVDFDGDGTIEATAADPEVLTYTYDRDAQRLVLQAAGTAVPVLAANVADFKITYTSRDFDYNGTVPSATPGSCGTVTGVKDSVVTWEEVDAHPSEADGNCDGVLNVELDAIDSVTIDLSVLYGGRQQVYRTTVDLRNRE